MSPKQWRADGPSWSVCWQTDTYAQEMREFIAKLDTIPLDKLMAAAQRQAQQRQPA